MIITNGILTWGSLLTLGITNCIRTKTSHKCIKLSHVVKSYTKQSDT